MMKPQRVEVCSLQGKPVVAGAAQGKALFSQMGLSFWGGVDAHTGCVIDRRHDLCGECLTGRMLCIPRGRGSCSSSGIIAEMVRANTAPAAILCEEVEGILAAGSLIAKALYGRYMPVYTVAPEQYACLRDADSIEVHEDGCIRCLSEG